MTGLVLSIRNGLDHERWELYTRAQSIKDYITTFENASFSLLFGLPSTLRWHFFCPELSEGTHPSGYIWKGHFWKQMCLVMWCVPYLQISMIVLTWWHFDTLFIQSSCYIQRNMTENVLATAVFCQKILYDAIHGMAILSVTWTHQWMVEYFANDKARKMMWEIYYG